MCIRDSPQGEELLPGKLRLRRKAGKKFWSSQRVLIDQYARLINMLRDKFLKKNRAYCKTKWHVISNLINKKLRVSLQTPFFGLLVLYKITSYLVKESVWLRQHCTKFCFFKAKQSIKSRMLMEWKRSGDEDGEVNIGPLECLWKILKNAFPGT